MAGKHSDEAKVEAYARALIDAGRSEGRANADLVQWRHACKFSPEVLETLTAMRGEDDISLVDAVSKKYKEILDSEDETVSVTVTTSVPMDDNLREKVRSKVAADMQVPIYLVERVDPSILGGIVIEAYGKRFDASVRTQLANIRKTLASTFVGSEEQ